MSAPRWVGASGLLLVVLLICSFVVYSGGGFGAPEADRSDATILDWYTDSGNQVRVLLAAMIGGLAVLAFLVFLVGFRRLLEEAGAPGALAEVSYVGGLVLAIIALVGIAIGSSIAGRRWRWTRARHGEWPHRSMSRRCMRRRSGWSGCTTSPPSARRIANRRAP